MKTFLKITACLLLSVTVEAGFAQQAASPAKQGTAKKAKKSGKKSTKEVDNKIAVSDEAQTADKSPKKQAKKEKGISNK